MVRNKLRLEFDWALPQGMRTRRRIESWRTVIKKAVKRTAKAEAI